MNSIDLSNGKAKRKEEELNTMEYTPFEQQTLEIMQRTDFKNLSKNDVLTIASKLSDLRPDVAKEVIAQFPEFVNMLHSLMEEYKDILGKIIASDDDSLKQMYDTADEDMDTSAENRKQFYEFADKVHADLSKCLDDPELTEEERKDILAKEMEILKVVSDKDTEIRNHETEIVKMVDRKDSEKRTFNWRVIELASVVLVLGVEIAASTLGGNFNFKLPKKS